MYSEQEERKYVNYLAKAKQDGPKQTFTRDPAPTNLEQGRLGLITKNDCVCKTEWCYHEDQFVLASQSYIVISVAFLCTMLYTFHMFLFLPSTLGRKEEIMQFNVHLHPVDVAYNDLKEVNGNSDFNPSNLDNKTLWQK